jgi:hypothetical protein
VAIYFGYRFCIARPVAILFNHLLFLNKRKLNRRELIVATMAFDRNSTLLVSHEAAPIRSGPHVSSQRLYDHES